MTHIGASEPRQHGFDVMIGGVEVEQPLRVGWAFDADDGLEQLLLVVEIDVQRALGHAGGAGDVAHAGGVEA